MSLLVSIDRGSQAPNLYMCDLKGGVLRNTNIDMITLTLKKRIKEYCKLENENSKKIRTNLCHLDA